MRIRGALAAGVGIALCAGGWSCNSVLGINEPQHALEAGVHPGIDDAAVEMKESGQPDQFVPDNAVPDNALPDNSQPEAAVEAEAGGDVVPDQALPEAGEDGEGGACGLLGQVCCSGTCTEGMCVSGSCLKGVHLGAGNDHTCVVLSDKSVRCWGYGLDGALGNGAETNQSTPVAVLTAAATPLVGATAVAGGSQITCSLLETGLLRCWGDNTGYQIGDGTIGDKLFASTGPSLTGVTDFSVGERHTCAVASGALWCWGSNNVGGIWGDAGTSVSTPMLLAEVTDLKKMSVGYSLTCVATNAGGVQCWGNNNSGQVGDGTTTDSPIPKAVQTCAPAPGALSSVQTIAAGSRHVCAITGDSAVWCWGDGSSGQLGNGVLGNSTCAVKAAWSGTATQIAAGSGHTCAITPAKTLFCWGDNDHGQVGDGKNTDVQFPTEVLDNVQLVTLGLDHTCALRLEGSVWCWGGNDHGQLGNGTSAESNKPTPVIW